MRHPFSATIPQISPEANQVGRRVISAHASRNLLTYDEGPRVAGWLHRTLVQLLHASGETWGSALVFSSPFYISFLFCLFLFVFYLFPSYHFYCLFAMLVDIFHLFIRNAKLFVHFYRLNYSVTLIHSFTIFIVYYLPYTSKVRDK